MSFSSWLLNIPNCWSFTFYWGHQTFSWLAHLWYQLVPPVSSLYSIQVLLTKHMVLGEPQKFILIFFVQIFCFGDLQISADVIYEKKPAMNEIRNIWQQSFGATANRTYELKWQRSRPNPVVSNQNPGRNSIYKYKVYCWRKDARHRQHNTSFCFLNVKNFFFYYWKCSTTASQ